MKEQMTLPNPLAKDHLGLFHFGHYRRVGTTRISDESVPAGTRVITRGGECVCEEESFIVVDLSGDVSPIAASAFDQSFVPTNLDARDDRVTVGRAASRDERLLRLCHRLFEEAIPKLDWKHAPLPPEVTHLLVSVPAAVKDALAAYDRRLPVQPQTEKR